MSSSQTPTVNFFREEKRKKLPRRHQLSICFHIFPPHTKHTFFINSGSLHLQQLESSSKFSVTSGKEQIKKKRRRDLLHIIWYFRWLDFPTDIEKVWWEEGVQLERDRREGHMAGIPHPQPSWHFRLIQMCIAKSSGKFYHNAIQWGATATEIVLPFS